MRYHRFVAGPEGLCLICAGDPNWHRAVAKAMEVEDRGEDRGEDRYQRASARDVEKARYGRPNPKTRSSNVPTFVPRITDMASLHQALDLIAAGKITDPSVIYEIHAQASQMAGGRSYLQLHAQATAAKTTAREAQATLGRLRSAAMGNYPGPTSSPGGSPGEIDHSSGGAQANAGGGHGQKITTTSRSTPAHAANRNTEDIAKAKGVDPMELQRPAPDFAVRDLERYLTPDNAPLFAAGRAGQQRIAKARSERQAELAEHHSRRVSPPGDWTKIDPDLYDAYAAGKLDYSAVAKSVAAQSEVSPAEVGEAWMTATYLDPEGASAAYERLRANGFRDDELDR